MDEKHFFDVSAIKDRLNKYREKERDIDNQIERLERLTAKMTGVGAQVITDMPRAPGTSIDRIAVMVSEKEELEREIREDVKSQAESWKEVEGLLCRLKHSDERAVIRIRYHDRENWSTVAQMMFGAKEDYVEKEDTYLRRVHKIHGSALLNLARMVFEDGENISEAI